MTDAPNPTADTATTEPAADGTPEPAWLAEDTPDEIESLMRHRGWLHGEEVITGVEKAGQGNMNVVLRVGMAAGDQGRTVILKQSRPWVAKYPSIPAPVERIAFERRWYEVVGKIAEVAEMMPRMLGASQSCHTLLLEDLGGSADLSWVYSGGELSNETIDELAWYLRALHDGTVGRVTGGYDNRAMRELNHAHIFDVPLQDDNGVPLEELEEGLTAVVRELQNDETFRSYLEDTGDEYLAEGEALLHGDFFPGSWVETADGVRVIDPEFGFAGPREFDQGVAVAHLIMAERPKLAKRFLESYGYDGVGDTVLLTSFTAAEIMRRLIGVAQLPLPDKPAGWRAGLLRASREALVNGDVDQLLS